MNMEQQKSAPAVSRKEIRKQKLMEYLAAKAKLKLPDRRPNPCDDGGGKGSVVSGLKVIKGKENEAPPWDRFKHYVPKDRSSLPVQSRGDPVKKVFGVKTAVPVTRNKTLGPSSGRGPTQPRPKLNPVLTSTYSVLSSRSNLTADRHPKKTTQANTTSQTSGKRSESAAPSVGAQNSRVSIRSKVPPTNLKKTISLRMSLGPMVKTRTGLIPAVIQPKENQSNPVQSFSSSVARAKVATKTHSQGKLPASTSQSVKVVHSTAKTGNKTHAQTKPDCKPVLGKNPQPSNKSRLSTAPSKAQAKASASKPACPSAARATQQRSVSDRKKNDPPTSRPVSRFSTRTVGVCASDQPMRPRVQKSQESGLKTRNRSENVPPPRTSQSQTRAPVVSQTAPQPSRTISLTANSKRAKVTVKVVAQAEEKKMTAAQEERLRKLQEWREAKGITYKRPSMPVKPQVRRTVSVPNPFWESIKEEDEAHSLISAVDRSLADCIKLLEEGCPSDSIRGILSRLPDLAQKFAKYWICQARLMEQEGNLEVLPMFEEAVRVVVEPVDELRTVVFEILKRKDEIQDNGKETDDIPTAESSPESSDPMMTPKPVRARIWGQTGDSSSVKYKITATPGGPQSQKKEPSRVNGHEVRFFTPVRRSVRIDKAVIKYPASLQDHDLCVSSYQELLAEEETSPCAAHTHTHTHTPMYVYRENEALKDQVFIQLLSD
ncbi:cytoskeleton-associated protein 2-like isoform X2 [Gouania willdenowi]|uniref:cytoskeleton-associated protein 2-like isoform X2 n=1 Tax=Gouania willdenowi TaxID=441366 RepID=UPI0010559857|nr:cytoskeleton-associated protein 2-like isoform X2 [Gouania willdenowi]